MIKLFKKHWPLIMALGILYILLTILLIVSLRQNQGHLVYALDDPYIHMAIAKNFAHHGVWGINKEGFTSSSSSLLWTLLLSLFYFLFGVNEVSPFIVNVIFDTFFVLLVYLILKKYIIAPLFIFIALLATIFLTPLFLLTFYGQEHIMHVLIATLFVYLSATILSKEKSFSKEFKVLLLLAPLLTMARYEGLFLIVVVSLLLLIRKRLLSALGLAGLGILPIIIYGAISISNGWYFLPNSVLLKGNVPELSSLSSLFGIIDFFKYSIHSAFEKILQDLHLLYLILASLFILILHYHTKHNKRKKLWRVPVIMIIIFIITAFLHLQFIMSSPTFRYDAYLVSLGLIVVFIGTHEHLPKKLSFKKRKGLIPKYLAGVIVILIIALLFDIRARHSIKSIPQATTNIYEQQYQMGLFLKSYYQNQRVAANDIGAINFLADIECVDIWGLGNLEVAKLLREKRFSTQQIYNLTRQRNVSIAIVYDYFYYWCGGLPTQWSKVGQWKISNNIVCGGDIVTFYAVDPSEMENLNRNLKAFSARLPKNVVQFYKNLSQ